MIFAVNALFEKAGISMAWTDLKSTKEERK